MAANKKCQDQFLTMQSIGPKGERHGWLRIKNCQDQFLTMQSIGPKGERHGWLRIKKAPAVAEAF
jgi:hypothetical protein